MRSHQSRIQPVWSVLLSSSNVLIRFAVTVTQSYPDKEFHPEFGNSRRENTVADNIVETIL
jgi:hypothetical protein